MTGSDPVNDRLPQLALRELRAHLAQPATLVSLAGVTAILALAGPFETSETLSLIPRALYWAAVASGSYACGFLASAVLRRALAGRPWWLRMLATGGLTGVGVTALIVVVNLATFGHLPAARDWPGFLGAVLSIALIVSVVGDVLGAHLARPAPGSPAAPRTPPLLDRLPLDKRGPLVALSVEDHYVRVRTTRGEELLLMRLGDAIRETDGAEGAQVHRSHWVAWDQVRGVRREGDRAVLSMSTGDEIPVSRANVPKLREAGLLPR